MGYAGEAVGIILLMTFIVVLFDPEGARDIYETLTTPTSEASE